MYKLKKYVLAFQKYNFIKKSVQYVYCYTITRIGIIKIKKKNKNTQIYMKNVIQKKLRIEKKKWIYEEIDIKEESCKQLRYKHNHYKRKTIYHHHI